MSSSETTSIAELWRRENIIRVGDREYYRMEGGHMIAASGESFVCDHQDAAHSGPCRFLNGSNNVAK